mmetsp:Transcript_38808/g.58283  ORF Transcript_38808/g.58283 Transcript_38808/m.58283 type:complete len:82 (-) Transcript_38808:12-257(-)
MKCLPQRFLCLLRLRMNDASSIGGCVKIYFLSCICSPIYSRFSGCTSLKNIYFSNFLEISLLANMYDTFFQATATSTTTHL